MPAPDIDEPPPSGVQFAIAYGHQQVIITEVGATLRSYTDGGEDVLDGFALGEMASGGRGQVLAPWPNRLGDGRYSFEGRNGRAALDEPERRNAIHGLVRWVPWQMVSRMQNVVTLCAALFPQPGYPWRLGLSIEFRLGREGLRVTTEATNASSTPAPFGIGFHPYLTVGTPSVDTTRLLLPAKRRLVTDERGLPTGDAGVGGTEFDFSAGRPIGPTKLDTAFTQLEHGPDGLTRVELSNPQGDKRTTLWMDENYRYIMVYTGDTLDPPRRRASVAIEPMTSPPDALRSGRDLIRLEPGVAWRGSWGITTKSGTGRT